MPGLWATRRKEAQRQSRGPLLWIHHNSIGRGRAIWAPIRYLCMGSTLYRLHRAWIEKTALPSYCERAILKDVPLIGKVADKILRDMKRMRRCGVYPRDVHPQNHVGGLLVDLSEAMTRPYWLFQIRPRYGEMTEYRELYMW